MAQFSNSFSGFLPPNASGADTSNNGSHSYGGNNSASNGTVVSGNNNGTNGSINGSDYERDRSLTPSPNLDGKKYYQPRSAYHGGHNGNHNNIQAASQPSRFHKGEATLSMRDKSGQHTDVAFKKNVSISETNHGIKIYIPGASICCRNCEEKDIEISRLKNQVDTLMSVLSNKK